MNKVWGAGRRRRAKTLKELRTRRQAALICAIAASNTREDGDGIPYIDIEQLGSFSRDARRLAEDAWRHVMLEYGRIAGRFVTWSRVIDAEAEALLRTGWMP